jgi:RES domain
VGVNIPISRVTWQPCWRIIPSRFPPIQLFERVADPSDLEAVMEIEGLTNPRLRDEVGDIRLVALEDRISGPGTSIIMAAFTHLNPDGSRFTDGSFGVCYAARELDTAIEETKYHRAKFMRATDEGRMELDMRVYVIDLAGLVHDLRGLKLNFPLVYHPESYGPAQHLAVELRKQGSQGVVYDSVRRPGGECVAIFRPPVLSNCRQERHLCYVWDGHDITAVYEKGRVRM